MHELVRLDPQFDWTHSFFHTNNWVAIAGRHLADELLLTANPIEFAIGDQLRLRDRLHQPAVRRAVRDGPRVGDRMFEKMVHEHPDRRGAPRADRPAVLRRASSTTRVRQYLSTSGSGAAGCSSRS
jgi:hypothetical protein